MRNEKHVLLGLSGGVDSAVCLALLQEQGYAVTGLYLENGVSPDGARDAQAVADRFGAELIVADMPQMRNIRPMAGPRTCVAM